MSSVTEVKHDCRSDLGRRSFKYWRAVALRYVVEAAVEVPARIRLAPDMLQCMALCMHMLNALIYRAPGGPRTEHPLAAACAHHVGGDVEFDFSDARSEDWDRAADEYEQGQSTAALDSRGVYFAADIAFHSGKRVYALGLSSNEDEGQACRIWDVEKLARLFGHRSFAGLQAAVEAIPLTESAIIARRRMGKTGSRLPAVLRTRPLAEVMPDGERPVMRFGLARSGLRIRPRATNILQRSQAPAQDTDPDIVLSRIWAQFASDVMSLVPEERGKAGPYRTMRVENVTAELFEQEQLPFRRVTLVRTLGTKWSTTYFDRFFPPRGNRNVPSQHFGSTVYYREWQRLMDQRLQDESSAATVRAKIREKFDKPLWLPHSQSDRMWETRKRRGLTLPAAGGRYNPAPVIAVNESSPLFRSLGTFTVAREAGAAGEPEDMEI